MRREIFAAMMVVASGCLHPGPHVPDYRRTDHLTSGDLLEAAPLEAAAVGSLRDVYPPGLSLTKRSEGWRRSLYNDAANFCTIGYGHLVKKRPCDGTEPEPFRLGLSEPDGARLLVADMANARSTVSAAVTQVLSDGQFAALCDFVFNIGSTNFRNSTLLSVVNAARDGDVPAQFRRWVLAGGKVQSGLQTRREREIDLYFEGRARPPVFESAEPLALIDVRVGEPHR